LTMLGVFVIFAAITIDYAYMQMVRSDLRIATDAAAKAGAEALARTENNNEAINAAIAYAASNPVAGQPLQLSSSDIVLGRVDPKSNGKWNFKDGKQPFNAVQVRGKTNASLFFGKTLGISEYKPTEETIAGYQEFDVMLCLDRSGSMCFDMSGVDYSYPNNNPNLSNFTAWGTLWRNYVSPPHPTNSRWAVLSRAVNDFLEVAGQSNPQPYVSLTTWGSDYTSPVAPFPSFEAATVNVNLPSQSNFQAQMVNIKNRISQLGNAPIMGGTNLSAGVDLAVEKLSGNSARSLSKKVIILLTDGQWNNGRDPILAANAAKTKGITIHTVSMLTNMQTTLAQIADITGGKSYSTQNETELREAFKDIAAGLRVVLVE
jgi:Ca-activated chloride channel homolog